MVFFCYWNDCLIAELFSILLQEHDMKNPWEFNRERCKSYQDDIAHGRGNRSHTRLYWQITNNSPPESHFKRSKIQRENESHAVLKHNPPEHAVCYDIIVSTIESTFEHFSNNNIFTTVTSYRGCILETLNNSMIPRGNGKLIVTVNVSVSKLEFRCGTRSKAAFNLGQQQKKSNSISE